MFNGPLPEETCYVDVPKGVTLCKKLGIEYVRAMWGFERKSGFSIPLVKGVVVFKKDADRLKKEAEEYALI